MVLQGTKNNKIRLKCGIKSIGLALELCALLCLLLNRQKAPTMVESLSSRVLPFSTNRQIMVASFDRRQQRNSQRKSNPYPSGRRTNISASAGNNNDESGNEIEDEPQFIEVESLSASQVMELIELSFFQACYALSKGDVEPLKLFIIAVKTASKKYPGASVAALAQSVDALPPSVRPLEPQERDLRETWIRAIYLMMDHVLDEFDGDRKDDDDTEVANTYGSILVDLVAIHRTGMGLNVNQFVASRKDILMPKSNVLALENGPEDDDLLRLAVVTQTINVLYTTLLVLEEEEPTDPVVDGNDENKSKSSSVTSQKKRKKTGSSGKGFG